MISKIFKLSALIFFLSCSQPVEQEKAEPAFKIQIKTGMHLLILAEKPSEAIQPVNIRKNVEYLETLPFDGMFVNSSASEMVMSGKPVDYNSVIAEMLVLKGIFKKLGSNFVYIINNYPGDLWDDNAWAITSGNFRIMAKAAAESGLKGIVIENQEAGDVKWQNYGDSAYRNPRYDLIQHRDQTILRGKQVMEAMTSVFPDIEVISLDGPYLSEPNYRTPRIVSGQSPSWNNFELLGPFFVGMLEGKGKNGTVIDGGRVFQYRTPSNFRSSYMVRKYEIASEETDSWFIPYKLRLSWPNHINIAFGVYDRQWKPEYPMNVDTMYRVLRNALLRTDKYVWFNTDEVKWVEPAKAPGDWKSMIEKVRQEL